MINDINKHKIIWEYKQKLGGLGGYASLLNVITNPFKTYGDYRNVFRNLQYSRKGMFLHVRPRFIIIDAALSLETLVKLLLSKNSVNSSWVTKEWETVLWDEINSGKIKVIPVKLEECEIPKILQTKKYIDFTEGYNKGLYEIIKTIKAYEKIQ